MKLAKVRTLVIVAALLLVPLGMAPLAHADDAGTLLCYSDSGPTSQDCDLSLDKQVKINDGEFQEAPTAAQAVTAKVGDTVTWQITVSNNSPDYLGPDGTVTVNDILPSGVSFVSASVAPDYAGTYTDGTWTFPLGDALPATLTIVTTATTTGLIENTASLADYTAPCYDQETEVCTDPPYNDANAANNTARAFVNIPGQVLGASTSTPAPAPKAPNTGFGIAAGQNPLLILVAGMAVAAGIFGLAQKLRRVAA